MAKSATAVLLLAALFPAAAWTQGPTVECDLDFEGPSGVAISHVYFASACLTLPPDAEFPYQIVQKVCSSNADNVWFEWMPLNFRSTSKGTGPRGCLTQERKSSFFSLRQDTSLKTPTTSYGTNAYLPLLPPSGQNGGLHSETSLVMTEEAGQPSAFTLRIRIDIHSNSYATSRIEYEAETGSFIMVLPPEYEAIEALQNAGIVNAGADELKALFGSAAAMVKGTYGAEDPVTEFAPVLNFEMLLSRSALALPAGSASLELVGEGREAFDRLMSLIENSLFCVVQEGILSCEGIPRERRDT